MASVTARKYAGGSVTWRVQFRIDGKMSQESFTTQTAAVKFAALVDRVGGAAARQTRQRRNLSDSPTLATFTDLYLDPAKGHLSGVTAGTRDGYRQIANRSFLHTLGPYPLDTITKQDVAGWVAWQEDQPSTRYPDRKIAAKTIRNYHGLLSAILTEAVDAGLIPTNPAKGTSLTRGRRQGVTFLTREEFETVLLFIPDYYRPLTLMLAGTGMRWGEATAITWADVNTAVEPAMLSIDKAWQKGARGRAVLGPPKTDKARRTISLWPELVDAMGEREAGGQLVFKGVRGESRMWSHRFHRAAWTPAVDAANDPEKCALKGVAPIGKRPRIHDLRHSHASWLIAAGVPLPYIQQRLGHENITTTVDLYGHMLPDMQAATVRVLSDVMSGVLPRTLQLEPLPPVGG
jgi:integrase